MIDTENAHSNNHLVIAVPSHGAYDFEGSITLPSPKSLDRVYAAAALYLEEQQTGKYGDIKVVFVGGWRGEGNPSTSNLMANVFNELVGADTNKSTTHVLGTSRETRANIKELNGFLQDEFDSRSTDVVIMSQDYHNADGRLERLAENLLRDFNTNTRFLSVERTEEDLPKRFMFAPELNRKPTLSERIHIFAIGVGHFLDELSGNNFKYEEFVYNDIDRLRQLKHSLSISASRVLRK